MAVANVLLRYSLGGIARIQAQMTTLQARAAALRAQLRKSIRLGGSGVGFERQLEVLNHQILVSKNRIREMSRATQNSGRRFQRFSNSVNTAQRGIGQLAARGAQLVFTLGLMARGLTDVAAGLTKTGGAVIGARRAFTQTADAVGETSGALLGQLKRASRGTISDFGLMSAANFAFLAGAKLTKDELNTLTEASVKLAAIGIRTSAGALLDAEEIFNRFTQGIVKQERRIVDDMTVVIRAKDVMKEFGASAKAAAGGNEQLARVIAFKSAIVQAASDRLKTLADVDISLVTIGSELTATFENFKNVMSEMFITSGAGTRLLEGVRNALQGIIERFQEPGVAEEFFNGIVDAVMAMINLFKILIPLLVEVLKNIKAIVFALAGLKIGALLAPLAAVIPGIGPALALALPFIGAAGGAAISGAVGDSVTAEQIGNEIGRAASEPVNMNAEQLATVTRVVRNQMLQPTFGAALA